MHDYECYYELGSQSSQNILRVLDNNWISFFRSIKDWSKFPQKYLGKPKLPNYKNKEGRQVFILKNTQASITDGILRISFRPFNGYTVPTKVKSKLIQVRFVPKGSCYIMEIVYETEVPEQPIEPKRITAIDLGIDNFATITNNIGLQPIVIKGGIIKSINQYYNKRKSSIQSELMLKNKKKRSKKLDNLTLKRNNRIKSWIHKSSKIIVDYCVINNIDTLVCGLNKGWKQECNIGKVINQTFVSIPYEMFINQLIYKCENNGIKFIKIEESYTSGTSFLDNELPTENNYDKSRRIYRGLFKCNDNRLINSDVNGSYQIMKKVFPNLINSEGIEGIGCYPVAI